MQCNRKRPQNGMGKLYRPEQNTSDFMEDSGFDRVFWSRTKILKKNMQDKITQNKKIRSTT